MFTYFDFFLQGENTNAGGESLSRLVSLCFGRSLNKSDQFSNWEQRPLRIGQKRYAGKAVYFKYDLNKIICVSPTGYFNPGTCFHDFISSSALDAFCLLQIHETIQKLSEEQGLPFLEVCEELVMGFRSPKKNFVPAGARRGRGRGRRPPSSNPNPGQGPSQGQVRGYYY